MQGQLKQAHAVHALISNAMLSMQYLYHPTKSGNCNYNSLSWIKVMKNLKSLPVAIWALKTASN